ncbi:N-acetylmuramoyl-L-alanine amidase [Blautia hansenii]|uniref:N-acetylmuramoyl-L-alanine amidase n=1 Tax=Blautia hansenii TaxID=1322 RepID=UPI0022E463EB|nr:N-acetylmuramoyl-L-alanine amidase [Blautia hansenii]
MKKKLAKWAVTMLAGAMLALPATGSTVSASSEAKSQVQEETKTIENELNYIYIDEAELDVGAMQSVVLSWGESTSDIRSIDLVVENEDGSRTVLNSQKKVDNLFLYEHSFEQGAYHVAELSVTTDLGTKTFTAEDLEINACFGVGEKVNDSVKSDYIEMESQSGEEAVVTIETANAATVEKNVADALSEQAVPFDKNKKERSNSNLVIVLDPGHDASKHSGATANGVREEVVTLKIAEYCKEVLEQYSSVSVYMTRTDGNCPYPDTNSIDDILKRVEWAKTKDADVFISFHINSSVSGAAQGAEVYYPQGEENAQELAKDIVGELAKLGLKNRGDKGDDSYAVIRHSKRNGFPGLIIEHAFVSNVSDAKWFQTEENLKKLGEADAAGIIKYYGLTKDKGKWEFTGEHWKWKEGNGKYATSTWKSIDGVWYYFDTNSNMTTGWQQIGGIWYYMNSSGAMTTGWQQIGGTWYYMNSSGAMQTGWQQIGGTWYYMNGSGVMQTGWRTIGNQTYYLNEGGAMATGWKLVENVWYYFNSSGYLLKGEQTIAGTKWYLDENTGALYTGWHYTAGKWYHHTNEGLRQTGWQFIDGTWYYMNADGVMTTGWQLIGGTWYYMDGSGAMQTGWQLIGRTWYYMDGSGAMQTGWRLLGNHWYYMNGSGAMLTGFQAIGNEKFYFNASGEMQTGWQFIDNVWYYFNTSGYLLKGEQTIGGQKWYLDANTGALYMGWHFTDGKWYYHTSEGLKQIGWQKIGETWYYMDKNGVMQTGWQTIGNQKYYFDGSGAMVTGWQLIDNVWYYFENSGELNNQPSSKPPVNDAIKVYYEIAGDSSVTVEQMVNYYKKSGKPYPAEALKAGGAATIEEFCQIYYEECEIEGIKAEVAFVQSMIETGFLQFGGSVKIEQFNFAGLGATGNGVSGNSFENVRIGIRAHVQHLKCYANDEPLKNECVDPRWGEWLRGKAPYVEWLSIPNNPNGTGWAGDADYAAKILKGIQDMKKIEVSMN